LNVDRSLAFWIRSLGYRRPPPFSSSGLIWSSFWDPLVIF